MSAVIGLIALLALVPRVEAQESLTDLRRALAPGETIWITDTSGDETRGRVMGIEATGLRLLTDGVEREWSTTEVREVRRRGDSLKNGTIIGAIAGGAIGAFGGWALSSLFEHEGRSGVGPFLYIMGLGTATGAGIGAGVDALIPGRTLVYRQTVNLPF